MHFGPQKDAALRLTVVVSRFWTFRRSEVPGGLHHGYRKPPDVAVRGCRSPRSATDPTTQVGPTPFVTIGLNAPSMLLVIALPPTRVSFGESRPLRCVRDNDSCPTLGALNCRTSKRNDNPRVAHSIVCRETGPICPLSCQGKSSAFIKRLSQLQTFRRAPGKLRR